MKIIRNENAKRWIAMKKSLSAFIRLPLTSYPLPLIILLTLLTTYLLPLTSDLMAYSRKSVGTSGAQFLKLGTNARAIGMGEAYSSVTDGSESIYWNPAGLSRVDRRSFSLMHAIYLQQIVYDFASYAQRFGELGVLCLGVQYLNAGTIDRTDRLGSSAGTYNPYDLAVSIGWSRLFHDIGGEDFMFGISGKYIRSQVIESAAAGAVDTGLLWTPDEKYYFSLSMHNMGTSLKFRKESDGLPFRLTVGSSYKFFESLLLSADINFPNDNHIYAAFGTEYRKSISKNFWLAGRAGYNTKKLQDLPGYSSFAVGSGIGWKNYSLDLSWQPFGLLGNSYLISLSGKF